MCPHPPQTHPTDVIDHVSAKLAFLGDAFSQGNDGDFAFSRAGQFGLLLILRGLEDELKAVENQLFEAEEVRS